MPFKTTPEIDFSSVGLITDVPTHSLPDGAWNDCLNLRCKDGSVQGVNDFIDDIDLHDTDAVIRAGKAMAVTQFTPAGYDYLILAFIVEGTDGYGHVITYNTENSNWNDITNSTAPLQFTFNDKYPPQIFVFNELLIVNPAVDAPPMFTDTGISSGSLNLLPSWPSDSTPTPLVSRILKPFGNRLMAMNIFEEHTASLGDDVNLPVDILWSSHITGIGSLTNVEWTASTTNTAGDAFAVETPGKILDGGQLGEFFIAYKSDSVIRVSETGDTYVLSFESIFEDDGIYSSRCFANIGDAQHLVVGNYGVYIHDGQSQKTDIAKGIFQDTIYSLINTGGCVDINYDDGIVGTDFINSPTSSGAATYPLTINHPDHLNYRYLEMSEEDPRTPGRFLITWAEDTSHNGFMDKWYVQVLNITRSLVTIGVPLQLSGINRVSKAVWDPDTADTAVIVSTANPTGIIYLNLSESFITQGVTYSSGYGYGWYTGMFHIEFLANQSFLITWIGWNTNADYIKMVGGTWNNGVLTWTNGYSLGGGANDRRRISSSAIQGTNTALVSYERDPGTQLTTKVVTVSGSSLTTGLEYIHPSAVAMGTILQQVKMTSGNRFVIIIGAITSHVSGLVTLGLITGTVTGDVVTYVSYDPDIASGNFYGGGTMDINFYDNNPDKFLISYSDTSNNHRAIIGSMNALAEVTLYEPDYAYEESCYTNDYFSSAFMRVSPQNNDHTQLIRIFSDQCQSLRISLLRVTTEKTSSLGTVLTGTAVGTTCAAVAKVSSKRNQAFVFHQTRDKEVWFCFPSEVYQGLGCDLAFVYDYNEKKLHKRSLPGLTDIFETEQDGLLKIYAAKPSDSKLQILSDSTYVTEGFFIHEDDNLSDNTTIKWINGIYLDSANSVKVGLDATQYLTDSKSYPMQTFDPTNSYKLDTRTTGRYMNIKIQMDGDKNPKLGKLQFDIKKAGKR